jgi:hypothetical protein
MTVGSANYRREVIITLVARHRLPAVYPDRAFVTCRRFSQRGASHLGGLGAWLSSMFRAKFAYETIIHANRFFMPIDFPLSCVDPWVIAPALAMLHLARFQEFKVPSTFGQVLFETVDKVIPDGHAEMPFVGVNGAAIRGARP